MKTCLAPIALISLAAALTAGCLSLKSKTDPTRYFVLSPLPPNTAPVANLDLTLCIARVRLPAYLDKRWLAIRRGNEIQYAALDEWAEALADGVQRVLTVNLGILLGPARVRSAPCSGGPPAYELRVDFYRFELDDQGQAVLSAQWELLAPDQPDPVRTGSSQLERKNPDAPGEPDLAVRLLGELLAEFSATIVAETAKAVARTEPR